MADTQKHKTATLTLGDESYDFPVYSPTAGPDVIDIRKLYADAGVFTYDPGVTATAACDSTITLPCARTSAIAFCPETGSS